MTKSKKRKTPSRIKYEHDHPTVSFRTFGELKDRLQAVKKAEGKSVTDVMKVGVGLLEVKISKEREARKQGYDEGFNDGYEKAEALYKVTYPCKVCRKMLTVTSKEEKEAIKRYMLEHGWGHAECHNRRY
jgi:hypothetical protein